MAKLKIQFDRTTPAQRRNMILDLKHRLDVFDLIAKIIEQSLSVSPELDLEQLDHKRGTIEGILYFADGSRLEFTERIVIERGRPMKRDYRYQ